MRRSTCATALACAGAVAAWLVSPTDSAAQDRDTMWSTVTAQGNNVALTWDKDHPWDTELSGGGARLVARYRSDARADATELMSTGAAEEKNSRTIRFTLPDDVQGRPIGRVCLFIQLPSRKVLPVRRANAQNTDTAGFHYEVWENQVRQRNDLRTAETRVAQAQRSLAVSAQSVSTQEANVARRGWTDAAACSAISAARADTTVRPYDVVAPASHDDVARRVCVYRVWNGRTLTSRYVANRLTAEIAQLAPSGDRSKALALLGGMYSDAFMLPEIAGPVMDDVIAARGGSAGASAARAAQAAEFLDDWKRLSPAMANYEPHLGSEEELLALPSTADAVGFRVFAEDLVKQMNAEWLSAGLTSATLADKEAVIGVTLDAYFGCLEDNRKQLTIKWDAWQTLQESTPRRAEAAREFFVRECQQAVGVLDKLRAEQAAMEVQLAREQAGLAALSGTTQPTQTRPQVLNASACSAP